MEIAELMSKKRQLLLKGDDGVTVSAIVDPNTSEMSKDGKYIRLGGYFTDTTHGWYEVEFIAQSVIGVVKEFEEQDARPKKRGFFFWKSAA